MPDIVAHGRKPVVGACAFCHLPDGSGRPENAMLAGLPAAYIAQQLSDMKSRARLSAWPGPYAPSDYMRTLAENLTDQEVADAAAYFSALRARQRSHVRERAQTPRSVSGVGVYFPAPDGGHEPLGRRIIEMPVDAWRHELHDPWVEYVAYVPPGSIARGRILVTMGRPPGVPPCEQCHGAGLGGAGLVPPLAGRSPSYMLRQLLAFRAGTRATPASGPMRAVAAQLELDDMIDAVAYAGSRTP
jgi:cytochrome c553